MPKVQVDLPDEVHGAVRVEAAVRGLSIAQAVVALCREAVMGPLEDGAPPVVGVVLEERRRPASAAVPADDLVFRGPSAVVAEAAELEVRAAALAEAKDRPVRSFPKPGKAEKKGRGRS